jgi:peptidoglycan/LPS O-acetylase OafA/YrhL
MSRNLSRRRAAAFVAATALCGAAAGFGASWDHPLSLAAGLAVLLAAPFATIRTSIGRSDDHYAAVAAAGAVALILGFVTLPDGPPARMLGALGVLLAAPAIVGPRAEPRKQPVRPIDLEAQQ